MITSILYSDTPESFYQELRECIRSTIREELLAAKKEDADRNYIKRNEVCQMLRVSKPTVDSHVQKGYYKKYCIGSRVFYNKQEIISFLESSNLKRFNSLQP
jgi:predicted DNA-binding transcriptional regulator AlpA